MTETLSIAVRDPADASGPTDPFWAGLQRGEFLVQCDPATRRHLFFPRALHAADGAPLPWVASSRKGTVAAHTVARVGAPGFEALVPYVLVLARLDEDPLVFMPLVGCAPEQVRNGMVGRVVVAPAGHPAPYVFDVGVQP